MPTEYRAALERAACDLLRALAELPRPPRGVRVANSDGDLACEVVVRPTRPRRRGGREQCRADILGVVRKADCPLTRKEVIRALREAGKSHGPGTVAKALAELTATEELVNPRDKRGYRMPEWRPDDTPSLFKND